METGSIPTLGDEKFSEYEKENERGKVPRKVLSSDKAEEVGKKQGE